MITGRPAPHRVPKRRIGDRLNRTTYNIDTAPINDVKHKNMNIKQDAKDDLKVKKDSQNKSEDEDSALPIIKDEDYKNNDEVKNQSIVSKEMKVVNTEHSENFSKLYNNSQHAPRRSK